MATKLKKPLVSAINNAWPGGEQTVAEKVKACRDIMLHYPEDHAQRPKIEEQIRQMEAKR